MQVIWLLSLVLALGSLLLVTALVFARSIGERRAQRLQAFEDPVRHAFVAFSSQPDEKVMLETLEGVDPDIVAYHCRNFLCLVRGEIASKLRVVLTELGIPRLECDRLQHASNPARVRAADLLSFFEDPETADALLAALGDPAIEVRIAAAISLSRRGVDFNVTELLSSLEDDHSFSKRLLELFEAMASNSVDVVMPIAFDQSLDERLRALAIEGMCRTKSPRLIDPLVQLSETAASPYVVAAILRGSSLLGHSSSLELAAKYIASAELVIQMAAIEAIGTLGIANKDVVQTLVDLRSSRKFGVRRAATNSLLQLGMSDRDMHQREARVPSELRLVSSRLSVLEFAGVNHEH